MSKRKNEHSIELIIHALCYAELGWRVFPLIPRGKKASIKAWQRRATTNTHKIRAWWNKRPEANIGILTGKPSGIVVLDVDNCHNGDWSLMSLELYYGKLPDTLVSYTGNGGKHYLFTYPKATIRNSVGKLGEGLDIRGNGGYIVAPPSQHPNGNKYCWQLSPWAYRAHLAQLPDSIIHALIDPEQLIPQGDIEKKPVTDQEGMYWVGKALERVHMGKGRNHSGAWLVCQLRDWGFPREEAKRFMDFYVDMVPSKNHPYTKEESELTLRSVFSRTRRHPAKSRNNGT